jgi:uncharacterized membrane protein
MRPDSHNSIGTSPINNHRKFTKSHLIELSMYYVCQMYYVNIVQAHTEKEYHVVIYILNVSSLSLTLFNFQRTRLSSRLYTCS